MTSNCFPKEKLIMKRLGTKEFLQQKKAPVLFTMLVLFALTVHNPLAAAQPKAGGQAILALNGDPKMMNPISRPELASLIVIWPMFERLARANPENMENIPELATSWEYAKDVMSLVAHLRKGVTWHDGRDFTAEDVKFTFDTIMNPKVRTEFVIQVSDLKRVEAIDPYTVKFYFKAPSGSFEAALQIPIIPKHLLEGKDVNTDEFNHKPVGTGPFKFEKWVPGDHVIAVANEKHWRGRPHLDRIIFKVLPDTNVRMAQLKTGEIDVMDAVEPLQLKDLSEDPHLVPYRMLQNAFYGFFWNVNKEPFNDIRVRKALNMAMDKKAIIERVLLNEAVPAYSVLPPTFKWAYTDDVLKLDYDPAKAKKLLAEAGWKDTDGDGILDKDGKPFRFTLTGDSASPTRRRITMLGQEFFKAIGLDVKVQFKEWHDFLENYQWNPDKEMLFFYNMYNPPMDPDTLSTRWHSASGVRSNHTRYANPKVDELLAKGKATIDRKERISIYHEIQRIIANDVPMILLYYPYEIAVANKRLKGIVPSPWRVYHNMEDWSIQ
jgi:peptide/nickel transport system substrate-binding protein